MNKKAKTGRSLVNITVDQVYQYCINKRGMHHHLLVHLRQETEVSTMARIRRTLRLDQASPKVVWHKEIVGLLHVVGVVEPTLVSVVMVSQAVSNAVKMVTT